MYFLLRSHVLSIHGSVKIFTLEVTLRMCSSGDKDSPSHSVGWPQAADMTCPCPDGHPFVLSVCRVSRALRSSAAVLKPKKK